MSEQHFYAGTHNVWYGEVVHDCGCGNFSSPEKSEVLAHIEAEKAFALLFKAFERRNEQARIEHFDSSANTR